MGTNTADGAERPAGASALRRGLAAALALAGPVFEKELRVSSRRGRTYLVRFLYLAGLTAFVAYSWEAWVGGGPSTGAAAFGTFHMATVGRRVTEAVLLFQFILLPMVATVMLSASMSEEIRGRTLGTLMTTPVGAFQIVLGKVLGKSVQLALLLAISLPLLTLVRVFGGVDWLTVVMGLGLVLSTCVFVGAVSMFVSTVFHRLFVAQLITLLVVGGAFLGAAAVRSVLAVLYGPGYATAAGFVWDVVWSVLSLASPITAMGIVTAGLEGGASGMAPWQMALPLAIHWLWMLLASLLAMAWCARRVRKVGLRIATGELRSDPRWRRAMGPDLWTHRTRHRDGVARIYGSPVRWRERMVHFGPSRLSAVVAWALLAGIVVPIDLAEVLVGWPYMYGGLYVGLTIMLFAAMVLLAAVQPAPAFAAERESGTLPLLLATPLSRARLVADKAVGAVRRSCPVWGLLLGHVAAYVFCGRAHPIVLAHVGLVMGGVLVFLTGSGLFFSAVVSRTTTAVLLNVCLVILLLVVPPIVVVSTPPDTASWNNLLRYGNGYVHPVWQIVAATDGAVLERVAVWDRPAGEPLQYQWAAGPLGAWATTAVVGATSSAWAAGGLALAALAARRLKHRAF